MPSPDSAQAAVRHANSASCLQVLREGAAPLTVTEMAELTALSRPTVDAVMTELSRHQVVRVEQAAPRIGAGRPARRFTFDAAAGHVAGIDAGPHSVRVMVGDLAGTVVATTCTALPEQLAAETRLTAVRGCLAGALEEALVAPDSLRAACIAVPGILSHDDTIVSSLAVPEWVGYPLVTTLQQSWGCPVAVENDIKLAALAEHRLGSVPDNAALTFVQIGHRVSVALIMDGTILQGSHRLAGELGSLRGMKWTTTSTRGELRWLTADSAKAVFARAAAGDSAAAAEIEDFCGEIAPKIATIILTIDPDVVVIGGGLSRAGQQLLGPLTAAVHHLLMTPEKPTILGSTLVSEGAVCGALGLAFERWSPDIFGVLAVPPPWPAWKPQSPAPTSDLSNLTPPREKAR
ncbi:MAG: hypothetical protein AVDCRST_MAG75-1511 [uncultured Propionibacteriaceae bacterium]|uniref:HTH iclR-type domain-containing protein n=1 Tax=uncultured Propionibacteriaceae bacterium TaxID=257457 RepID=A0A6J4NRZ9_9ACTN|nr:MAG: hypothetical protein AVDCRST_MAG75-1511 [uncultured Propionibacteriaceae bacterium]